MPQAVKWNIFLYADGSCPNSQQEYTNEIKKQLNKDSENIPYWFADSMPSAHLDDDKTKPTVFAFKLKKKVKNMVIYKSNKHSKRS